MARPDGAWDCPCGRFVKAHHKRCLCGTHFDKRVLPRQNGAWQNVDRTLHQSERQHRQRDQIRAEVRADQRRRSQSRKKEQSKADKELKQYASRVVPMTRIEAVDHETYQEASGGDALAQKRFQDDIRSKMLEVARLAMAARRANELEDATRYDVKLSVL